MAVLLSLAWHALIIAAAMNWSLPAPISFARLDPGEVEFSVAPEPEEGAREAALDDDARAQPPNSGANAEATDAPDAEAPATTLEQEQAQAPSERTTEPAVEPSAPNPSKRIKPPPKVTAHQGAIAGNSVVLRIDTRALRTSILRDAFENALTGLEEWDVLLGGTGVSPARDTDALIIASPDMSLERTLIVGRAVFGPARLREVAERLARLRGTPSLNWNAPPEEVAAATLPSGVTLARWLSRDPTTRHIAVVPPNGFVISTLRDLEGGLALLGPNPTAGHENGKSLPGAFDLPRHALLGLRVEDLSLFIRLRGVPTPTVSFAALMQKDTERFHLDAQADFADPGERDAALAALRERLERYRFHPLLRLAGFASLLDDARLQPAHQTSVRLIVPLTYRDVVRLLALLPRKSNA